MASLNENIRRAQVRINACKRPRATTSSRWRANAPKPSAT